MASFQHPYNALLGAAESTFQPRMADTGREIVATIRIPQKGGRTYLLTARANYELRPELGWFGSSAVRKVKEVAKKVAKNKVVQKAWKTMPVWANAVPPPYGQALAAGAAAAQAAQKIVKSAKSGNPKAKKFLDDAKKERETKKKAAEAGLKLFDKMKKGGKNGKKPGPKGKAAAVKIPPALAKKAMQKIANQAGDYTVIMPSGKSVKIPASKLQ